MKKNDAEIVEVVTEENKTEIALRDMNRKHIKALRAAGLDPAFVEINAQVTADLVDWIIDNIYPDLNLDDMPYYEVMQLAMNTYTRAVKGPEVIKNS